MEYRKGEATPVALVVVDQTAIQIPDRAEMEILLRQLPAKEIVVGMELVFSQGLDRLAAAAAGGLVQWERQGPIHLAAMVVVGVRHPFQVPLSRTQ